MNVYDSDRLAQALLAEGFTLALTPEEASLVLINTCAVREKPEKKALSLLGRMLRLKAQRPGLRVGLLGCVAQKAGGKILRRFPGVDFVLGPRETGRILDALRRGGEEPLLAVDLGVDPWVSPCLEGFFRGRASAFISIMEGCNHFCTYCIVPYVRGRERSRPSREILREVRSLLSSGIKEITLLGQNVDAYGDKGERGLGFSGLLREVASLSGIERLRFTTSHPKELSDDVIACFETLSPTLCPHIHLPFQAGSDRVLKKMGRGYRRGDYLDLIRKLRLSMPSIALSADVMVGFPGETEEEFEETLDLVRQVRFDTLFSFAYSDREGTPAAAMQGKISTEEKLRRLKILQSLQRTITLAKNEALVGSVVPVLVEGLSKRGDQLTGRSPANKVVNFPGDQALLHSIVPVRITHGLLNSLRGEMKTGCHTRS